MSRRVCPFQHTAARRRLGRSPKAIRASREVSTHSRPKAAGMLDRHGLAPLHVSTHSRPKAAGAFPPKLDRQTMFQHTAARRRLAKPATSPKSRAFVSTHSRPKAAGRHDDVTYCLTVEFQHTAARRRLARWNERFRRSRWFQHTAARRRLGLEKRSIQANCLFQHTAARRRLVGLELSLELSLVVSTHSRPKAAG